MPGAMELTDSFEAAFVLGPVGLGYNRESDTVLVQLDEVPLVDEDDEPVGSDDDEDDDRSHVRLLLTRSQAAAYCARADEIVSAGRAVCRWCSRPIDPDGHACPRMN